MFKKTIISKISIASIAVLILLTGCGRTKWNTSLDNQFSGLKTCNMSEMYVNTYDMRVTGNYFTERELTPCRLEELAYFCVDDHFHEMPVSQVAIPYKGFSIYALYIDLPLETVRSRLEWSDLNRQPVGGTDDINAFPQIASEEGHSGRTILYCEPYEEP